MSRRSAPSPLQGSFRVEMLGSQESLDLDCGKFFTVRVALRDKLRASSRLHEARTCVCMLKILMWK